jgi:hypothetical protein
VGLGLLVDAFLVLCAPLHSVVGWSFVRQALADAGTPPDLAGGVDVAWRLGGFSMVGFGAIVLGSFGARALGRPVSPAPVAVAAATWTAYGAWSFVEAGYDPFFAAMFLVPGLLLALATPALR